MFALPSSQKTSKLSLNNWSGSDKPKRSDFNSDNQIIDSILGGHVADSVIHVTQSNKDIWNSPHYASSYFGTNAPTRTISLNFTPSAVFVAAESTPFQTTGSDSKIHCNAGFAARTFHTPGISIGGNGFQVEQSSTAASNACPNLNASDCTYIFIAFR